jgi:hypothetical protein
MENSSQIAWNIVPLRHFFTLKVVPLIEVLLYIRSSQSTYRCTELLTESCIRGLLPIQICLQITRLLNAFFLQILILTTILSRNFTTQRFSSPESFGPERLYALHSIIPSIAGRGTELQTEARIRGLLPILHQRVQGGSARRYTAQGLFPSIASISGETQQRQQHPK